MNDFIKEIYGNWRQRNHMAVLETNGTFLRCMRFKKQMHSVKILFLNEVKLPNEHKQSPDEMLRFAVGEFDLQNTAVVLRIMGNFFRHRFLRLPKDFEGDPFQWVNSQIRQILPPGMQHKEIIFSTTFFANENSPTAVFLSIARKDLITKWMPAFEKLGVQAAGLYGNASLIPGFMAGADPDFYNKRKVIGYGENNRLHVFFSNYGDITDYREILLDISTGNGQEKPTENLTFSGIEKAFQTAFGVEFDEICIAGADAGFNLADSGNRWTDFSFVKPWLSDNQAPMWLTALTMGMFHFNPLLEATDMRPDQYCCEFENKRNLVSTLHFGGCTAVFLITLWVMLALASLFVDAELSSRKIEMAGLDEQIAFIDSLKTKRDFLRKKLALKHKIVSQRSSLSRILHEIASVMPRHVWLRSVSYGAPGQNEATRRNNEWPVLTIEGLALAQSGPTELLANLEKQQRFERVELQFLQTLPAKTVYKKTKRYNRPLFKFRLAVWKSTNGS